MPKLKDLTGQRFGKLTAIERTQNDKHGLVRWICICDCGKTCIANACDLMGQKKRSCGCLQHKHDKHDLPIYNTWSSMKKRCLNPNHKSYACYGGRGISVYPEWIDSFKSFYDYVSTLENFGKEGYSLDRINNSGNYEPNNLRWADNETQQRNRRNTIFVEYNGRKISLVEVAELIGIPYKTIYFRYHKGDRGEKLFRPLKKSPLPAFRKA